MIWSAAYSTGNVQVDNEHKEIFMLVQNVIEASRSGQDTKVGETIDFLANYTVTHFKNEERLMEESAYPEMPIHKQQHDDFVAEVLALRARSSEASSQDIEKIIVNWLTDHVLGSDKLMATHYRNFVSAS
jgi:hemerythrin-like metal-binding protein